MVLFSYRVLVSVMSGETLHRRPLESPIGVLPDPPQYDLRVVFTQLCVVQFDALMCAAASPVHAWVPLNPSPACFIGYCL